MNLWHNRLIDCYKQFHTISYSCDQAGEYNCKISQVTNDGDTVISVLQTKSVYVNITRVPVVIQQQPPAFLELKEGEDFTIKCIAYGHPEPRYQWFRDNTKLEGKISNVLYVSIYMYIILTLEEIVFHNRKRKINVPDKTIQL